jgi:flagellar basal body-associated protein FliL
MTKNDPAHRNPSFRRIVEITDEDETILMMVVMLMTLAIMMMTISFWTISSSALTTSETARRSSNLRPSRAQSSDSIIATRPKSNCARRINTCRLRRP